MQITINQTEIERAISEYVNKRIKLEEGVEVAIDIRATRGPEGITAVIDIDDSPEVIEETKVAEKARRKEVREEKLENASTFLKEKLNTKKEETTAVADTTTEDSGQQTEAAEVVEEATVEAKPRAKSIFNKVIPN